MEMLALMTVLVAVLMAVLMAVLLMAVLTVRAMKANTSSPYRGGPISLAKIAFGKVHCATRQMKSLQTR